MPVFSSRPDAPGGLPAVRPVMSVGLRPAAASAIRVDLGEVGVERETPSGGPGGWFQPSGAVRRPAQIA